MSVMLYKLSGPHRFDCGTEYSDFRMFDYTIVDDDADAVAGAIGAGWALTLQDAVKASEPKEAPKTEPLDISPPTRAEMEAKAAELGLDVDGRWGDARLLREINEAIAKAAQ